MNPYQNTITGMDAFHTVTTQTSTLANSLLMAPFNASSAACQSQEPVQSSAPVQSKPHQCPWEGCGRYFACPHNVQQHIREKHTLERPYKCELCTAKGLDIGFARRYGLNRHTAQVHGMGKKPERAAAKGRAEEADGTFGGDAGNVSGGFWEQEYQFGAVEGEGFENEFAETAALLMEANNAQMGSNGNGDVQMSDAQFHFDAEEEQSSGNVSASAIGSSSCSSSSFDTDISCGTCGSTFPSPEEIYAHQHSAHRTPKSRLCSCNECRTFFFSNQEDLSNHAKQLREGAFSVPSDFEFSAGVADFAAMSPFSHHPDNNQATNAAAAMNPASLAGFADGTIDPELLALSAQHGADAGTQMPDFDWF